MRKIKRSTHLLLMAILVSIGSVLQWGGIARGLLKSPVDWVGIAIYCVTTISLALAAWGLFTLWKREKRQETPPE